MLHKVSIVLLTLALVDFGFRRILSYLRYFQQEEYNSARFLSWLKERRAFDSRGSGALAFAGILLVLLRGSWWTLTVCAVAATLLFAVVHFVEEDPRKSGKLKLNMTQRARKIALQAAPQQLLQARALRLERRRTPPRKRHHTVIQQRAAGFQ